MIDLKGIHKTFQCSQPLHVLKGVDLHIDEGELVSIMGPSGSGKSTMLNIMGILDDYDEGEYHLAGHLIKHLTESQAARVAAAAEQLYQAEKERYDNGYGGWFELQEAKKQYCQARAEQLNSRIQLAMNSRMLALYLGAKQ